MNKNLYDIKILLVVRSLIENDKGEILLLKRNKTRNYNSSKWELPGGKVAQAETVERAIERILDTETGLCVVDMGVHHYIHNRYVTEPGKYKGFNYFEVALSAKYVAGTPRVCKEDHVDFLWVNREAALDIDLSLETKKAITAHLKVAMESKASNFPEAIVVSRAFVTDKDGKILLMKRTKGTTYGDKWEIPGGKLKSFESVTDHLVREVFEETGLVVNIDKPAIYISSYIPKEGVYRGVSFVNIINIASVKAGKPQVSSEHSEYVWVDEKEVLDYDLAEYLRLPLTEILEKW